MRVLQWKQKGALLLAALGAALLCFYVSRSLTIVRMARAQAFVTPYTLEIDTFNFETNPAGELISKKIEARRGDGTWAGETTSLGKLGLEAGETVRRIVFTDGRSLLLADSIAAKTTYPRMPAERVAAMKKALVEPRADCTSPGFVAIGSAVVAGQQATVVVHNEPSKGSGGATQRLTEWRIRALSCQRIQFRLEEAQADGSWKLVAEGRPVSLTLGEPDPRLFEERAGYVELKPSERVRRQLTRLGHPEAMADWAKWAERQDKLSHGSGCHLGRFGQPLMRPAPSRSLPSPWNPTPPRTSRSMP